MLPAAITPPVMMPTPEPDSQFANKAIFVSRALKLVAMRIHIVAQVQLVVPLVPFAKQLRAPRVKAAAQTTVLGARNLPAVTVATFATVRAHASYAGGKGKAVRNKMLP